MDNPKVIASSQQKKVVHRSQRNAAYAFGIVFITAIIALAIIFPNPTPFQYTIFRIVMSLAAAGIAAMIPGFIEIEISNWIRAGGALGVFVLVYFNNPAELITKQENGYVKPKLTQEQQQNYDYRLEAASWLRESGRPRQALVHYREAQKIIGDDPKIIKAIDDLQKQIGGTSK